MTCDERRDLLLLAAMGALEAAEDRALQEHCERGCPRCAGAQAEAEALLALLPLTLGPVAPPPGLRERLLARVATPPVPHLADRAPARTGWRPLLAAAAAAGIVLALSVAFYSTRQSGLEDRLAEQARLIAQLETAAGSAARLEETVARQASEIEALRGSSPTQAALEAGQGEIGRLMLRLEALREELAGREAEVLRLRTSLDERELRLAAYHSPEVRVFTLRGTEAARRASARVFWNPEEARWDLYTTGLDDPGLAKTYQLWLITADDRKIPAGTFDVVEGRAALLDVRIPRDAGPVVAAAVTDEPLGGSLRPSGAIRLVGELPRS